ncbi:MAG: sensor histidine kinase [Tannerellaceae bacterium]|jgi:hypothetical protein|nr:sensor histidine kinase [Tannerellaceae bacterium]
MKLSFPTNLSKRALLLPLHLLGWAMFIYLTAPPSGRMRSTGEPFLLLIVLSYLFLAAYFYCNSELLVPRLLSRKKILLFLGTALTAYMLFCVAMPLLFRLYIMPEQPFRPEMPPGRPDFSRSTDRMLPLMSLGLYSRSSQFLVIFIISTGLKALAQWYREKQQLQELEKSKIQAELSFLKSQIHPHFLFNCLNSIYFLCLSKDDKAPKTILSLSDFLRFVIIESESDFIPLEKEIQMLEEYLNLQSLRTTEKFELQFVKEGDFKTYSIMPLTFVPFVENAFKFGISAHTNCFIHIRTAITAGGTLDFSCDNSIASSRRSLSSGVGLDNIRKRLMLAYPNRHSLKIYEDSAGFHVKLQIGIS